MIQSRLGIKVRHIIERFGSLVLLHVACFPLFCHVYCLGWVYCLNMCVVPLERCCACELPLYHNTLVLSE